MVNVMQNYFYSRQIVDNLAIVKMMAEVPFSGGVLVPFET